jgi:hypothetical protein
MSQIFAEVASCTPSQSAGSYIYAIAPTTSHRLAAITSADELLLVDLQNLPTATPLYFTDVPVGLTSMIVDGQDGTSIHLAGRDGTRATFDVRSQRRTSYFTQGMHRASEEVYYHQVQAEFTDRPTDYSSSVLRKRHRNRQ